MSQIQINPHDKQFEYLGRWVNKEHFRAFVYNRLGEQIVANSYNEFESLIASGLWYASKKELNGMNGMKQVPQKRKQRHGSLCADS